MNFIGLDNSKAPGYDNISINSIKNCAEILYVPLTYIFNTSIRKSVFPDLMKLAKVCPIDKGGEEQSVTNYKPISLLPMFAKVFEKIICHALTQHLEENNLLLQLSIWLPKATRNINGYFRYYG